jgi:hypothetical protein
MQNVSSVFRVQLIRIGVDGFSGPKALWSCIVDGSSANDNGIGGGSQEAHDEAISEVSSTDCGAASLTFYCITDNTVKGGNEVCKDEGTLCGCCLEVQIPIVEISQARWKTWFQFVLIAINEGPYRRHLFASSFSESSANTASEDLVIVEVYNSRKTMPACATAYSACAPQN